jgi:anaerobic ribonucleoside-triphosphate reductase activating protein
MSRDTWDADAGQTVPVETVLRLWQAARERGASGVTISGGEPTAQAPALIELVKGVRADAAGADILLFTGLEQGEAQGAQAELIRRVDAVVFGRFDVTAPSGLVWRGSANQALVPLTALGVTRFGEFVEAEADPPQLQFAVEDERIWIIGVPGIGDLTKLERAMRLRGVELGGVSWRP